MNKLKTSHMYAMLWITLLSVYGSVKYANADTQPCLEAFENKYHDQVAVSLAKFEETSPDHYDVDNILLKGADGKFHQKDNIHCVINGDTASID